MFVLNALKQELTNFEANLNVLGDVQATVEQDMEQHNAQRNLIVEDAEQEKAWEAKMDQVRRAAEKLVGEVTRDQFWHSLSLFLMDFFSLLFEWVSYFVESTPFLHQ